MVDWALTGAMVWTCFGQSMKPGKKEVQWALLNGEPDQGLEIAIFGTIRRDHEYTQAPKQKWVLSILNPPPRSERDRMGP